MELALLCSLPSCPGIRETIRSHFEKEKELYSKGIKTLSLFFIDEVAKYRKYDEDGNEINSEYGDIFEQEYTDILNEYLTVFNTPYEQYLRSIDVHSTHAGYFSIDKKGHKVDSSLKRGSDESDDISAYDLILKDKERLLSFENPVRFIFSHSALREGWDNPNVFQICTLKHGGSSPTQKRQEVGRGLRLCVNQNGERQDYDILGSQVQKINQLTVIASDGYKDFVADLQKGIREDLYDRPTKATAEYFIGKTLNIGGSDVTVSDKQGRDIYRYLIKNDYIDEDDHVTDKYRADLANDALAPVPESCKEITDGVHALIQSIFDEHALDDMISDGHETKIQENALNDNFYKKEFQTLWNYINHKYAYTVEFDSDELIRKAITHIDLSHTAKLLYTLLLDRATLSQKNNWMDERGFVYVIFPLSALSKALRCSTMSIKRALRSLEDADLIERRRGRITVPNSIFVKVPTAQKCFPAWNDSVPSDGTEMISSTEQKCSTNQRNKNLLKNSHLTRTTDAHLTFGEYQNVFLTAKEYRRLKADFSGLDDLIEQLSAYIQSTGKKYADHAATLRIWAKRQKSEQKQAPGIPDYTFTEGESL